MKDETHRLHPSSFILYPSTCGSEGSFRLRPYRLAPPDDSLKPKRARTGLFSALPFPKCGSIIAWILGFRQFYRRNRLEYSGLEGQNAMPTIISPPLQEYRYISAPHRKRWTRRECDFLEESGL